MISIIFVAKLCGNDNFFPCICESFEIEKSFAKLHIVLPLYNGANGFCQF